MIASALPARWVQLAPVSPVWLARVVPELPVNESEEVSVAAASPSRQWLNSPEVEFTAAA